MPRWVRLRICIRGGGQRPSYTCVPISTAAALHAYPIKLEHTRDMVTVAVAVVVTIWYSRRLRDRGPNWRSGKYLAQTSSNSAGAGAGTGCSLRSFRGCWLGGHLWRPGLSQTPGARRSALRQREHLQVLLVEREQRILAALVPLRAPAATLEPGAIGVDAPRRQMVLAARAHHATTTDRRRLALRSRRFPRRGSHCRKIRSATRFSSGFTRCCCAHRYQGARDVGLYQPKAGR